MKPIPANFDRVLVTGSAGMLGSAVVRALKRCDEYEVIEWTRDDVDLRSSLETSQKLATVNPDYLIHCAAKVGGVQANIDAPADYLLHNLQIDASIIQASLEVGIRNFVYVGSSCMYPKDFRQPLLEKDLLAAPLEPTNEGYALSKIAGSKLASYISKQYGLNYKTLIPSNLYGPGDNYDQASSHLMAASLRKAMEAKEKMLDHVFVWGDGQARREFTHVDDVSRWIADSLDRIQDWPEALNLGLGVDFTVEDFHKFALRAVGHEARLVFQVDKPVGMNQKLLDSSLARTGFGWEPKIQPDAGLRMTLQSLDQCH